MPIILLMFIAARAVGCGSWAAEAEHDGRPHCDGAASAEDKRTNRGTRFRVAAAPPSTIRSRRAWTWRRGLGRKPESLTHQRQLERA